MGAAEAAATTLVLNAAWQVPLAVGLGWLLARALRRARARTLHRLWTFVLTAVVLAPLAGVLDTGRLVGRIGLGSWVPLVAPPQQSVVTAATAAPTPPATGDDAGLAALWERGNEAITVARPLLGPGALLLVLLPASFGALRLALAMHRARQLRLSAWPLPESDPAVSTANAIARAMRSEAAGGRWRVPSAMFILGAVASSPRAIRGRARLGKLVPGLPGGASAVEVSPGSVLLLRTAAGTTPAALGILRPAILLPERLLERCSDTELRAVLAHELAHVERRDAARQILNEIVLLPLRFHPFVRILRRRLAESREMACDEAAAGLLGDGRSYARSLLDVSAILAGFTRPLTLPGVLGAGLLEARMRKLSHGTPSLTRRREGIALVTAAFVLIGANLVAAPFTVVVSASGSSDGLAGHEPGEVTGRVTGEMRGREEGRVSEGVTGGVTGGVSGGVRGGVSGGVLGGVRGGVKGGVSGGVRGGVSGGVLGGVPGGVPGGVSGGVGEGIGGSVTGGVRDGLTGGVSGGVIGGAPGGVTGGIDRAVSGGISGSVAGGGSRVGVEGSGLSTSGSSGSGVAASARGVSGSGLSTSGASGSGVGATAVGGASAAGPGATSTRPVPERLKGTWYGRYDEGDGKGLPGALLTISMAGREPRVSLSMHRHLKNADGTLTSTVVGLPVLDQRIEEGALRIRTRDDHFLFRGAPEQSVDLEWRFDLVSADEGKLRILSNSYFAPAATRGESVPPPPPPMKMARVESPGLPPAFERQEK